MSCSGPDQLDAFRRLGGAVIYRWDDLPDDVQNLLLGQAILVGNEDHPGTTREQLFATIQRYKQSTFPG